MATALHPAEFYAWSFYCRPLGRHTDAAIEAVVPVAICVTDLAAPAEGDPAATLAAADEGTSVHSAPQTSAKFSVGQVVALVFTNM